MSTRKKPKTQNASRGNSRAAQNRAVRREALREELKAREYVRQLTDIADRLNPDSELAYEATQIPAAKVRADILFRLLDKALPNLRPVDQPVAVEPQGKSLTEHGASVIAAMGRGEIPPGQATDVLQALASQARVIEIEELEARVRRLEARQSS